MSFDSIPSSSSYDKLIMLSDTLKQETQGDDLNIANVFLRVVQDKGGSSIVIAEKKGWLGVLPFSGIWNQNNIIDAADVILGLLKNVKDDLRSDKVKNVKQLRDNSIDIAEKICKKCEQELKDAKASLLGGFFGYNRRYIDSLENRINELKLFSKEIAIQDVKPNRPVQKPKTAVKVNEDQKDQKIQKSEKVVKKVVKKIDPTPLYDACKNGNIREVERLVKLHPTLIDMVDSKGNTPLLLALKNGKEKCALYLIKQGANLTIQDSDKRNALYYSCRRGFVEIVEMVIKMAPQTVDARDKFDNTPVFAALFNKHEECAKCFLNSQATLNVKNINNKNLLHLACQNGYINIVKQLVDRHPELMDEPDKGGNTPLHYAFRNASPESAEYLVKKGASLDVKNRHGKNALHFASEAGFIQVAKICIEKHPDFINMKDLNGNTPLSNALSGGHGEFANYLLGQHASLNFQDKQGNNLLHLASKTGLAKAIDIIAKRDPSLINSQNAAGNTPLMLSLLQENEGCAKALIKMGAALDIENNKQQNALYLACKSGFEDVVKMILKKNPKLVNTQDKRGDTPLHIALKEDVDIAEMIINQQRDFGLVNDKQQNALHVACKVGCTDAVQTLLKKDPKLLNTIDINGNSPLLLALQNGHKECAQLLINGGAKVNVHNHQQEHVIHLACKQGYLEIATAILKKHPDLMIVRNQNGDTILHCALASGNEKLVKYLIKNGVDIDAPNNDMVTALHIACEHGETDIAKLILRSSNATIDTKNKYGNTPLHRALLFSNVETAEALIRSGADVNIADDRKKTALHLACEHGLVDIVQLLLKNEASMDVVDADGNSPLSIALKKGESQCAQILLENGGRLDKSLEKEFGAVVDSLDNLAPVTLQDYSKELKKLYENNCKVFLKSMKEVEIGSSTNSVSLECDKEFEELTKKMDEVYEKSLRNIKGIVKNIEKHKKQVVLDLQDLYLDFISNVQKKYVKEMLGNESEITRFKNFENIFDDINDKYKKRDRRRIEEMSAIPLNVAEKLLEKQRESLQAEYALFAKINISSDEQFLSSDLLGKKDLYLSGGICAGSTLYLASEKVKGSPESKIFMQPNARSRFLHAAYSLSFDKEAIGLSNNKEEVDEFIDKSLCKKLGVDIKPVNSATDIKVSDFIDNIETLLPKMNTEKSPHFMLELSGEHSEVGHVIYLRLSPPYEIQDVNFPGRSIETNDILQFKKYLLLYFTFLCPGSYEKVDKLWQVSKQGNVVKNTK